MSTKEEIQAAFADFCDCLRASDVAGLADKFAEDAVVLPPMAQRIDGRTAIRQFWEQALAAGLSNISAKVDAVEEMGDWAVEIGTLTAVVPGPDGASRSRSGKRIATWHRGADGNWRIKHNMWNYD